MKSIALVPKLRFPGYKKDWREVCLSEISKDISYGMNSAAIKFDGTNKYLRITDIDEDSRAFVPKPLTSPNGIISDKFKLKFGDIVFARTGASVGKSYLYKEGDGKLFYAGFLIKFSITNSDPYFVFNNTFSSSYNKWVKVMSMRSGQPGINAEEYKTFRFNIPSIPEQQKIASFLTSVDKHINLLEKKKQALEQYKKGVMQKLFSQKIRFKDEHGNNYPNWEEKKLGEFDNLEHGDGNWILSKDISKGGQHKIVQLGNIGFGSYVEKELKTISSERFYELKGTPIKKGDLLINRMIDNGLNCCLMIKEGDFITSVDVCWIRENTQTNNYFIMSLMLYNKNQVKLLRLSSGSGRVRISKKNLFEKFYFNIPCINEQTQIANFLLSIDKKVELTNTQIEKSKEFKKGLLQKMFV